MQVVRLGAVNPRAVLPPRDAVARSLLVPSSPAKSPAPSATIASGASCRMVSPLGAAPPGPYSPTSTPLTALDAERRRDLALTPPRKVVPASRALSSSRVAVSCQGITYPRTPCRFVGEFGSHR